MKKSLLKLIRINFPGGNNKGVRKLLKKCNSACEVRALENFIAFSARGKAGIEAIARDFENLEY